jgi:hypothetical protein
MECEALTLALGIRLMGRVLYMTLYSASQALALAPRPYPPQRFGLMCVYMPRSSGRYDSDHPLLDACSLCTTETNIDARYQLYSVRR